MCRCCAVNSVGSSVCSRYDPDVLRQEVAVRKQHVEQLRRELRHMKTEMQHTQDGVHALSMYDVICFTHIIHHMFTLVHFVFHTGALCDAFHWQKLGSVVVNILRKTMVLVSVSLFEHCSKMAAVLLKYSLSMAQQV